jgi:hypothetical protein
MLVRCSSRAFRSRLFGLMVCSLAGSGVSARADDVASALYVRTDTDHTTVISPRIRASQDWGETTRTDVTYSADVWTSASIDIRASASVRPVTEQRDEIDFSLKQDLGDFHLHADYRFSTEPDYKSHGLFLGAAYDLADKAAKLDANVRLLTDTVGRAGNPSFARAQGTVDASLAYTQLLDQITLVQFTYEAAHIEGYQASPYRFVGMGSGSTGYACLDAARCMAERVPERRTRNAFAALVRRALSDNVSVGINYRYYLDDWKLTSHTLLADLTLRIGEHSLLQLRYRYYAQGHASFYRMRYLTLDSVYRTRDRELSALSYQRAGIEFERNFALRIRGGQLAAIVSVSGNRYHYDEFVGLGYVSALEISAALVLEI